MFALSRRATVPPLAGLLAASCLGCLGPRVLREPVYEQAGVEAYLRSYEVDGEVVPRGFDHPAIIAGVRLSHILAFVDVEIGKGEDATQEAAVAPQMIFATGDALSAALEQAGPDQEVVVRAVRHDRRFGIFTRKYLTSFLAHVEGGQLVLSFGHVDWEIPKARGGVASIGDELPEPEPSKTQMRFRIVPNDAVQVRGTQTALVDWRDDRFRDPQQIRLLPTGEVRRRTILLQAPPEPESEAPADVDAVPSGLSPQTLRDLADLEEARRQGEISEAEYRERRRALLEADGG